MTTAGNRVGSGLVLLAILVLLTSCTPPNHMSVGVGMPPSGDIIAVTFPCDGAPFTRLTFVEAGPPWREAWTTAPTHGTFGHEEIQVGAYRPGWVTRMLSPWELSLY